MKQSAKCSISDQRPTVLVRVKQRILVDKALPIQYGWLIGTESSLLSWVRSKDCHCHGCSFRSVYPTFSALCGTSVGCFVVWICPCYFVSKGCLQSFLMCLGPRHWQEHKGSENTEISIKQWQHSNWKLSRVMTKNNL